MSEIGDKDWFELGVFYTIICVENTQTTEKHMSPLAAHQAAAWATATAAPGRYAGHGHMPAQPGPRGPASAKPVDGHAPTTTAARFVMPTSAPSHAFDINQHKL